MALFYERESRPLRLDTRSIPSLPARLFSAKNNVKIFQFNPRNVQKS